MAHSLLFDRRAGTSRPVLHPRSDERLWTVHRMHGIWSSELTYYGESSVEARILRNARLFVAMMFQTRNEAIAWAQKEREEVGRYEWLSEVVARVPQALSPYRPGKTPRAVPLARTGN